MWTITKSNVRWKYILIWISSSLATHTTGHRYELKKISYISLDEQNNTYDIFLSNYSGIQMVTHYDGNGSEYMNSNDSQKVTMNNDNKIVVAKFTNTKETILPRNNYRSPEKDRLQNVISTITYSVLQDPIVDQNDGVYINIEENLNNTTRPSRNCSGMSPSIGCSKKCCTGMNSSQWESGYCQEKSSYIYIPWNSLTWSEGNNATSYLYMLYDKILPDAINQRKCFKVNVSEEMDNQDSDNRILFLDFVSEFYCTDNIQDQTDSFDTAFVCFNWMLEYIRIQAKLLYPMKIIGTISTFMPLALGFIFLLSPKKNLQIKCLVAFCFAVFASDFPSVIMFPIFVTKGSIFRNAHVCRIVAVFRQFALISASLWTTILCADKARALRESLKIRRISSAKHRFLYYNLISCGGPFLLAFLTLILIYFPENINPGLRPVVHVDFCGLQWYKTPTIILHDLPLYIILFCNSLLIMCMTYCLIKKGVISFCCRRSNEPQLYLRSNSLNNEVFEFKQRVLLYILLQAVWFFKMVFHFYRSESFIIMRMVMKWLQYFRGFTLFVLLAHRQRWKVVREAWIQIIKALQTTYAKVLKSLECTGKLIRGLSQLIPKLGLPFRSKSSNDVIEITRF